MARQRKAFLDSNIVEKENCYNEALLSTASSAHTRTARCRRTPVRKRVLKENHLKAACFVDLLLVPQGEAIMCGERSDILLGIGQGHLQSCTSSDQDIITATYQLMRLACTPKGTKAVRWAMKKRP